MWLNLDVKDKTQTEKCHLETWYSCSNKKQTTFLFPTCLFLVLEKCHLETWYSCSNKKQTTFLFPTCLFLVLTWRSSHKMTVFRLRFILYFFKLSSGCGTWPWRSAVLWEAETTLLHPKRKTYNVERTFRCIGKSINLLEIQCILLKHMWF